MANLVNYISGKLRPYTLYITIAFIVIIFILLSIYLFLQFKKKTTKKNKKFDDVANKNNRNNEIEVMMFHVNWCPHCKSALPDWQSFCDQYDNKIVNDYLIRCNRNGNNCTDENDPSVIAMISSYKIDSYPTIILMKGDQRFDFDAKITKNSLDQFLQTATMD